MEVEYRTRLTSVLDVTRFLLKQRLAFRGHDESSSSLNKGNFLELLEWYSLRNDKVFRTVNQNAPGNNQMTSPKVQKELVNACAAEITCAIVDDIGDKYFSLMIDEARDVSVKEQMGVVLRYVDKNGYVIERFLAMVHVSDTSAISLKNAIDCLFAKHGLSIVLKENPYVRYIHCFAHQLQLVNVVVAKDNRIVSDFFQYVIMIVNAAGSSCKRKDQLRQHHHDRLVEQLEKVEIVSGRGKHQESSLARLGDTRWGSHYTTILRLISMWTSVLDVLQNVHVDGASNDNRGIAANLIEKMENYQFVFVMYLMRHLLGITNELSLALQQKDQNIVQAMRLIEVVKARLQDLRETGCEAFLEEVSFFCEQNSIPVPNIGDNMRIRGHSRREGQVITHFHHYHVEIFCEVIDLISQEMQNRFPETSTELLLLLSCLDPRTASVERVFSVMNIVKTDLRNKMGDEWMNDSLVVYIECEVFATIDNEAILQRFQKMQTRRMQLPPLSLSHMAHISSINTGIGSSSS
ncbi:zinc finger MYM-type protein 1-like, partial [Dioscorea cayenensis subsp. rotundata]|uniref:Zinc finger MYM-type protein 1-like n=1 Tax=Dioscorea cayennensis subsp. rotundata TaxID=55577 RepID=A0AB40AXD4_DIOCR